MPETPLVQLLLNGSYIYEASTAVADIDPSSGNGQEIIIGGRTLNTDGSLGCAGKVYVVRASGALWWEAVVRADVNSAAAIGDLNGDGFGDVVVGMGAWNGDGENAGNECGQGNASAPGNGGVVALNGQNGSTLWTFDTADWGEWGTGPNGVLDGVYSSPALGDVNGDGFLEVAFGAWDDCIYLLDHNGRSLWGRTPFAYNPKYCNQRGFFNHDTVWSSPALADLDGDGKLEIVIGGDISCTNINDPNLCNQYMVPNGGFLWVIRADGSYMARRWLDQAIYSSPAIADLDRDGVLDIVVGTGQAFPNTGYYVTAWNLDPARQPTDALVQKWQANVVGRTFSSPALGDLDGNGILDVVMIIKYGEFGVPVGPAANNGSYIYALRGNDGGALWRTHACNNDSIGRSFPISASPVLADVTGDDRPEVFFPHTWEIHALNSNGTYLTQVNRANGCTTSTGSMEFSSDATGHGGGFSASVAVADLNGDGTTEIIAPGRWDESRGSNQGVLYIWRVNRAGPRPWPMFRADGAHTGVFDTAPPQSQVSSPAEVTSPSVTVNWSGMDDGSGIASYAIQVRQGTTGAWTTWRTAAAAGSAAYNAAVACGTQLYFRSIATDQAGNVESPPDSGFDASTRVGSAYAISGRALNNAGQPVFKAAVSSATACAGAVANPTGRFTLYYAQPATAAEIAVARSGFGQLPSLQGLATGSADVTVVLPPLGDAMQNGGFERGDLSSWVGNQAGLSRPGYSGQYAVQVPAGGSLQQIVTVPAKAVLSLLYRVSNPSGATGTVTLSVDPVTLESAEQKGAAPLAGITIELPVSPANWRQAAVDVSRFANQAVTVRLATQGGIVAFFDDFTLGAVQPGVYNAAFPTARR